MSAEDIAEAARRINERLKSRPKDKELKRAKKAFEGDYAPRMKRYEDQLDLFQERNSFSKTDKDATFMRMKEDPAGSAHPKAAYNVQISTENQIIVASTLHRRAGDTACMIDHLEYARRRFSVLPDVLCADAGYGSEENYAYLERCGVRAFVKHGMFHKEQKSSFKKDPASTTRIYSCADCGGCPHHFRRFALRGLEKISLEWGLVALGHNMRKLLEAITRENANKRSMMWA